MAKEMTHIGEHFALVISLVQRIPDIGAEDACSISNAYAVGFRQLLAARECPACYNHLERKPVPVTPEHRSMLPFRPYEYHCTSCSFEMLDYDKPTFWQRVFGLLVPGTT